MSQLIKKYLTDYKPSNYSINNTHLTFTVSSMRSVHVISVTNYIVNTHALDNTLILDGSAELMSIALNDKVLKPQQYNLINDKLCLNNLPEKFTLKIETMLYPWDNKSCMGLFASGNTLLTQCEPEGFRKITYYLDRPDVLTTFITTIIAPKTYPVLLSNGNKITQTTLNEHTHSVTWNDPFKKPSYLFAVVIGNLEVLHDTYTTKNNRLINLEIYSEPTNISLCKHAMASLKKAMQWDEERFNLEYDLNTYMIVATNDFNMGAMENKGLNIFNTKYVIADHNMSTDNELITVEAVIGHEYFHNWTGNRVTCRDWFQLSLKEGLTVFRDGEFTADLYNRDCKRIEDVKFLRQTQFPEDSGPLSHSVQPTSYIEINNFYTVTIYEKGAELVRMYQTILGKDGFKRGLTLYLNRHDGMAATINDFCQAMMDANNFDLAQFMLWYQYPGTPHIKCEAKYDSINQIYSLHFTQKLSKITDTNNQQAMLIPITIALIYPDGTELTQCIPNEPNYVQRDGEVVLLLNKWKNSFTFSNIPHNPTPSILRGFSAPVNLEFNLTTQQHIHLITYSSDKFNCFESLQILMRQKIIQLYQKILKKDFTNTVDEQFLQLCKTIITNPNLDPEYKAINFALPTFNELLPSIVNVHPKELVMALSIFAQNLGEQLFDVWMEYYNIYLDNSDTYRIQDLGKRKFKNICLWYILNAMTNKLNNPTSLQLIETLVLGQYYNSHNMTDSIAVLYALNHLNISLRTQVLNEFYNKWQFNSLVMDKWLAIQASSYLVETDQLNNLMVDKVFIDTNPNKIYALLRSFTNNGLKFHSASGYAFIADKIISIDKFNPTVASILTQGFHAAIHLTSDYQRLAQISLKSITQQPNISNAVQEIANKIIAQLNL